MINNWKEFFIEEKKKAYYIALHEKVMEELQHHFRPEFINRIDEIIIFKKLSKSVLYDILDKIVGEIEFRLKDSNIKIHLTEKAKAYFIDNGFDEYYGARPLKRLVSRELETLLAHMIINNEVVYGQELIVDVKDDKVVINKK